MHLPLFDLPDGTPEEFASGAWHLRGFATNRAAALWAALTEVTLSAPWRRMLTPGGQSMSVDISNCGALGWISDRRGYQYSKTDPLTGIAWPVLPETILQCAQAASRLCRFEDFVPDACLINRYQSGARMSLHQDKNERDFSAPIVSISLGLPATFLFGGLTRNERALQLPLLHGDVLVWGGASRLRFHGVKPVAAGTHDLTGEVRINLTLRKAG